MKILALEFSSDQRSVAVVDEGRLRGRAQETGARANRTLSLVQTALGEARLEREQIECLAIGLGPGSYTGIRSAIALAQGWQLALGTKMIGVNSFECLAAGAQLDNIQGRVNLVIDAQRDEFYLARYNVEAAGYQQIEPVHLAGMKEVLAHAAAGEWIAGPQAIHGLPHARILFPDAATLGKLAATRNDFIPGEMLEPIYLREPRFVKATPPRIALREDR